MCVSLSLCAPSSPFHTCFFALPSGSTLCKDLRLYLSKCFTPGSVDSQLQQVIRENLYLRAVPCKSPFVLLFLPLIYCICHTPCLHISCHIMPFKSPVLLPPLSCAVMCWYLHTLLIILCMYYVVQGISLLSCSPN